MVFRAKGHYDAAGSISEQELEQAIKVAEELHQGISAWLKQNQPELLKVLNK
jgi:hypothetical protein